jgi:hypothetical protein
MWETIPDGCRTARNLCGTSVPVAPENRRDDEGSTVTSGSIGSATDGPEPVALARELATRLEGLTWGIGGSVLMWRLGLEASPRDLDIVTTSAHFTTMRERIASVLGPGVGAPHPRFRSTHFVRFENPGFVPVDLFADVKVETHVGIESWSLDEKRIEMLDGLPWTRARDWLELYRMFDRRARVEVLETYLSAISEATESGTEVLPARRR